MQPPYVRASVELISDLKRFYIKDSLRFNAYYKFHTRHDITVDHFEKKVLLGVGSFGYVYLIQEKETGSYFALKQMVKKKLLDSGQVNHARSEKRLLQAVNCPFLISLKYFFLDNTCIYYVLPYISGGELSYLLHNKRKFDETLSRFYAAQMVLGLEYLHHMKVVYRDLKLENILLDVTGYIKITDFGFAKLINNRTYTFCGTPEYIAPEIINNRGYGHAVDWWAFGVIIYEMNHGSAPFLHWDHIILYEMIVKGSYTIPDAFSDSLKDIVRRLIQVDLTQRIGNLKNGVEDIKRHMWFRHVVWLNIWNRTVVPPIKPGVFNPTDLFTETAIPDEDIEPTSFGLKEFDNF